MKTYHYLLEDVFSGGKKPHLYGKAGEKVLEISRSDKTLIVEGKKERFPVNENKLKPIK